jgi:hypothetical protein
MAQMSYEEFIKFNSKTNTETPKVFKPYVRYFSLKDDGDTAIVRFNVEKPDDIRITSKHIVKNTEGKIRNVACLRQDRDDPLSLCPLCEAGEKIYFKAYVPLLNYVEDENGETVASPCLWEQRPAIRETLKSFIMEYGDLRDYVFKIVRHGKAGDTQTTYAILPANQNIYKEEVFKKDFSAFEDLDFERFVATRTAEEMNKFLEEGDFPNPYTKKEEETKFEPKFEDLSKETPVKNNTHTTTTNPLRTSSPIQNTCTSKAEEKTTAGPRRYSY